MAEEIARRSEMDPATIILMVVAWFAVGVVFGVLRGRWRYRKEIAAYPALYEQDPASVKRDALIDAAGSFLAWSFLGAFAAVAWILWKVVPQERR